MMSKIRELKQPATFCGLSSRIEDAVEEAYFEMKARQDPTNKKYPNTDERYAFKMAIRSMFYKLRGPVREKE